MAEMIRTGAAARIIGCSVEYVRELCRTGKLASEATPFGFRVLDREAVEMFARKRERAARARRSA